MAKRGPVNRTDRRVIQESLREIIESGQILGLTEQQLAKEYGVSRNTMSKYLKELYQSIPEEDIHHVSVKLDSMFKRMFREAQRMVSNAQNDQEKRVAMDFLLKCIKEFTEFLERFGKKTKAPERFDVRSVNYDVQIDVESLSKEILEESNPE